MAQLTECRLTAKPVCVIPLPFLLPFVLSHVPPHLCSFLILHDTVFDRDQSTHRLASHSILCRTGRNHLAARDSALDSTSFTVQQQPQRSSHIPLSSRTPARDRPHKSVARFISVSPWLGCTPSSSLSSFFSFPSFSPPTVPPPLCFPPRSFEEISAETTHLPLVCCLFVVLSSAPLCGTRPLPNDRSSPLHPPPHAPLPLPLPPSRFSALP